MDLADAMEDDESTRIVSAESNARLLAHAFRDEMGEEPTLDATAPLIPRDVRSSIGHGALDALAAFDLGSLGRIDAGSRREHAVTPPKTTFTSGELDELDLPSFTPLSLPDGRTATMEMPPSPRSASTPIYIDEHIPLVRSGVRERLTPEAAHAIVQRYERPDRRVRTRWIVLGVWAAAISLAAALGFIAATSPGPGRRPSTPTPSKSEFVILEHESASGASPRGVGTPKDRALSGRDGACRPLIGSAKPGFCARAERAATPPSAVLARIGSRLRIALMGVRRAPEALLSEASSRVAGFRRCRGSNAGTRERATTFAALAHLTRPLLRRRRTNRMGRSGDVLGRGIPGAAPC
jgi:hypothetical protein